MHESYIINEGIFLGEEGWKGGRNQSSFLIFLFYFYRISLQTHVTLTFVSSMRSLRVQLSLRKL